MKEEKGGRRKRKRKEEERGKKEGLEEGGRRKENQVDKETQGCIRKEKGGREKERGRRKINSEGRGRLKKGRMKEEREKGRIKRGGKEGGTRQEGLKETHVFFATRLRIWRRRVKLRGPSPAAPFLLSGTLAMGSQTFAIDVASLTAMNDDAKGQRRQREGGIWRRYGHIYTRLWKDDGISLFTM